MVVGSCTGGDVSDGDGEAVGRGLGEAIGGSMQPPHLIGQAMSMPVAMQDSSGQNEGSGLSAHAARATVGVSTGACVGPGVSGTVGVGTGDNVGASDAGMM